MTAKKAKKTTKTVKSAKKVSKKVAPKKVAKKTAKRTRMARILPASSKEDVKVLPVIDSTGVVTMVPVPDDVK